MKQWALLIFSIISFSCKHSNERSLNAREKFPDFQVQLIDSVTVSSTNHLVAEGPVVIFVFDPECPFCKEQLKDLMKNTTLLRDVTIYMVTIAPYRMMKAYSQEFGLGGKSNIVMWRDTKMFVLKKFNIQAAPFTAVYDRGHLLKQTFYGKIDAKIIHDVIDN